MCTFPEQHTEIQQNIEALPGESVTLATELPEPGLEVTWLRDNVPLSMTDSKYETVNADCSYQLVIADVSEEDSGQYKVKGASCEAAVSLIVNGE